MKQKSLNRILALVMSVILTIALLPATIFAASPEGVWTAYAASNFDGGTGTDTDPYQIATAEQLAKLSKDVSEGTSYQWNYFILTADIDLSAHRWSPIGIYKWEDDGNVTNKSFQGFLDGKDKTISGMYVDETDDKNSAGLFGYINILKDGGTVGVKNLTIADAVVIADENGLNECSAGILAARVLGTYTQSIIFENIVVSGSVTVTMTNGTNNIGGMLGNVSWAQVTNCHADGVSVSGGSNSGGFAGLDGGTVYENCTASGTVDGTWVLGGFVGYSTSARLKDPAGASTYTKCAADVDVNGSDWRVGGFAGYAGYGEFYNCVAYGDVTSSVTTFNPKVGGFAGESGGDFNDPDNSYANATNCHAAGTVVCASANYDAGGFTGTHSGGTFSGCSFDSEKNSNLNAAGEGTVASGVTGEESAVVLANICEDYYGGHQYSSDWTIETEPTCTTEGSKYQTCERCGAKGNVTFIPATGHTLTKTKFKEPTCEDVGYEEYWKCETCGKMFSDENGTDEIDTPVEIPALGHSLVKVEGKEPTCTESGNIEYWTCDTCGKYFADEKAETEITLADTVVEATGHKLTKTEAKDPTCTESGNIEYWTCDTCGKIFADEKAEIEITLADTVIDKLSEHTADGTGWHFDENGHWNTCQCGEKLNESAHTFVWIIDKEAEIGIAGKKHEKCTVCGYEKTAVEIPALEKPETPTEEASVPETGENSNLIMWAALLLLSAGVLSAITYKNKKQVRK